MPIFNFIRDTLTELFKKLRIDNKFIDKKVRLFINQAMCLKPSEKKKLRHNKNIF